MKKITFNHKNKIISLFVILCLQAPLFFKAILFLFARIIVLCRYELCIDVFFCDIRQRLLNAYTLKHINPYIDKSALSNTIGKIPEDYATSPWGLTLQNVFYLPFTKSKYAALYLVCLSIIVLILLYKVTVRYFKNITRERLFVISIIYSTFLSIMMALESGNMSAILCCFVIYIVLYHKEHPVVSGIMLGFCLIKPQMCLLICIVILLERELLPLIIAAILDMIGYAATCILLNTNPIVLLEQFLHCNVGFTDGVTPSYGIFSFLFMFNIPSFVVLYLSMLIGIILTILGYYIMKNKRIENPYIKNIALFTPSLLCLQFWSYSWNLDKTVIIPVIILMTIIYLNISLYVIPIFFCILCLQLSPVLFTEQIFGTFNMLSMIMIFIAYMIFLWLFSKDDFICAINNIDKAIIKNIPDNKIIITDMDGTLYNQTKLRLKMGFVLANYYTFHILRIRELIGILLFRRYREKDDYKHMTISELSDVVSKKLKLKCDFEKCIRYWIEIKPLKFINRYAYTDIITYLNNSASDVYIYSDYPAKEKAIALGLNYKDIFYPDNVNIKSLKPNSDAMLYIINRINEPIENICYIGDRYDKDGASAKLFNIKYVDVHKLLY